MFSEGSNPLQLVNKVGEAEDDKEGDQSANESIDEDVLDIFEELFFFEIVATWEDHRREEGEEEDFFTELKLREIMCEVDDNAEDETDEYAGACFMNVVELNSEGGTW